MTFELEGIDRKHSTLRENTVTRNGHAVASMHAVGVSGGDGESMTPKPRPTARTRPPWATRALSATSLLAMLSLAACGEERCPQKLNISDWCGKTGRCTVDGATAECYEGGCQLPKGAQLEVPIEHLADLFIDRREIEVSRYGFGDARVDPKLLIAEIDGVRATHLPGPGWQRNDVARTVLQWEPFPGSPGVLTLLNDAGPGGGRLKLELIDYACEDENRDVVPL